MPLPIVEIHQYPSGIIVVVWEANGGLVADVFVFGVRGQAMVSASLNVKCGQIQTPPIAFKKSLSNCLFKISAFRI